MASGDSLAILTPASNQPPATNYAALTVRNGRLLLAFDATTQQTAIFAGVMPRTYGGGGITAYVHWAAASAVTGTIGWDVTFEREADAGDDLDADNWASPQTVTAATVPGASGVPKYTNAAIAAGAAGTDSVAAGDAFRLRIRRDVAADSAAGDAHLISVELKET